MNFIILSSYEVKLLTLNLPVSWELSGFMVETERPRVQA